MAVYDWTTNPLNAIKKWGPIEHWNTSQVTNMGKLFYYQSEFTADLSGWDTGNVLDMSYMFYEATSFQSDLSGWDTGNVLDMSYMFYEATSFQSDLSGWDIGNCLNRVSMMCDPPSTDTVSILERYTIKLNRCTHEFMNKQITHEKYQEKYQDCIGIINTCRKKMGRMPFQNALEFCTGTAWICGSNN
jgi:surface protein